MTNEERLKQIEEAQERHEQWHKSHEEALASHQSWLLDMERMQEDSVKRHEDFRQNHESWLLDLQSGMRELQASQLVTEERLQRLIRALGGERSGGNGRPKE
jgi:hypothetical protein